MQPGGIARRAYWERSWGVPRVSLFSGKNGGQPETEGGVSALDRNLAHIYRPQEDND